MKDTTEWEAISRTIDEIRAISQTWGLDWTISRDWDELRHFHHTHLGKPRLQAIFDPDYEEFPSDQGFWIRGTDAEGRVVHIQAIRLIDLRDTTLADFLASRIDLFDVPGKDALPDQSIIGAAPICRRITGRAAYHGLAWGEEGFKGPLAAVMPRALLLQAYLDWQPDWIFGFIHDHLVYSGFGIREGYRHCEPAGVEWKLADGSKAPYHIVWFEGDRVTELADYPVRKAFDFIDGMQPRN